VSRLLMGSVAEQIVRRARCPVLTIRLRSSLGGEDRG
jgi:nucleotide-binding universal stress UspA family protein